MTMPANPAGLPPYESWHSCVEDSFCVEAWTHNGDMVASYGRVVIGGFIECVVQLASFVCMSCDTYK